MRYGVGGCAGRNGTENETRKPRIKCRYYQKVYFQRATQILGVEWDFRGDVSKNNEIIVIFTTDENAQCIPTYIGSVVLERTT